MSGNEKFFLDVALVGLVIVLLWTGLPRWLNNRNGDPPR
jgi:hypothetical protein